MLICWTVHVWQKKKTQDRKPLLLDKSTWSWPCGSSAAHGAQRLWRWGNGLCWDRSMVITPASYFSSLLCWGRMVRGRKNTRGWVHVRGSLWENKKMHHFVIRGKKKILPFFPSPTPKRGFTLLSEHAPAWLLSWSLSCAAFLHGNYLKDIIPPMSN